jgi:hypothetical protein
MPDLTPELIAEARAAHRRALECQAEYAATGRVPGERLRSILSGLGVLAFIGVIVLAAYSMWVALALFALFFIGAAAGTLYENGWSMWWLPVAVPVMVGGVALYNEVWLFVTGLLA